MGFVLKAPGQKTLYEAGDIVWIEEAENALNNHKPDNKRNFN